MSKHLFQFSEPGYLFQLVLSENELTDDGVAGEPYFRKIGEDTLSVGGAVASAQVVESQEGKRAVVVRTFAQGCTARVLYTHLLNATKSHSWQYYQVDGKPDGVPVGLNVFVQIAAYVDLPYGVDDVYEFLDDVMDTLEDIADLQSDLAFVLHDDHGPVIYVENNAAFIKAALAAAEKAEQEGNAELADFYRFLAESGSADVIYIQ